MPEERLRGELSGSTTRARSAASNETVDVRRWLSQRLTGAPRRPSPVRRPLMVTSRLFHVSFRVLPEFPEEIDRKSTRLNSSHSQISYAVFCLKKKKKT